MLFDLKKTPNLVLLKQKQVKKKMHNPKTEKKEKAAERKGCYFKNLWCLNHLNT